MPTRYLRILSQILVFALWIVLVVASHHPVQGWIGRHLDSSLLLRLDPLVMTVVCGGLRMGVTLTLLGAVTLLVSLALGRVFCGWVCPLGSIFDLMGWALRRFRVRIEGPSPDYFRLKYYLLAAILVLAVLGGVSPLMGLDPIVLVTRVGATVVGPLATHAHEITWRAGAEPGYYGWLIDGATLVLFIGILAATTRLSRIWCRVACPLGAYLGTFSRYAILRRETSGCVHCNLCAVYCPTGAIDFSNEEIYNESECIKCFACSDECPVDANFFTLKPPLPVVTASHFPVSLERRSLLTTAVAAVVAAPAMRLSAGEPGRSKFLLRPPMSRSEGDFLLSCIRCNACVAACPTGILKTAGLEHGLRAWWSPVMVPVEGPCRSGCNACSQACPTDAIAKYPVEQKYAVKAGTAVLETSRCISYTENKFCSECIRACPTAAIAIAPGWKPAPQESDEGGAPIARGTDEPAPQGQTAERPAQVRFDACIGCGACEYACNQIVVGNPAMVTTAFGRGIPSNVPAAPIVS